MDEILKQLPSMSVKELYELYIATFLDNNEAEVQEQYNLIRFGTGNLPISIEIYDIIDEDNNESSSNTTAVKVNPAKQEVVIYGQTFRLSDYRSEKEVRVATMRSTLLKEYSNNSPFESKLAR